MTPGADNEAALLYGRRYAGERAPADRPVFELLRCQLSARLLAAAPADMDAATIDLAAIGDPRHAVIEGVA